MNHSDNTPSVQTPEQPNRRKLLQGAAASGAFVALIAGKPVFGAQTLCSPSGFHSGNLSGTEPAACNGKSPGYWKNNPGAWASTGVSPGFCTLAANGHCKKNSPLKYSNPNNSNQTASKYKSVFGALGTPYDDMYIMQYMREFHPQDPRPTKPMVWHLTAAYLNASAGISGYVLSPAEVVEMWKQLIGQGSYSYNTPSGLSIPWGGDKGLQDFLESSYHDGVLV